jgi:hypothetical protein
VSLPPGSETRVAAAALLRSALDGGSNRAVPHLLVRGGGTEWTVALADGLTVGRGPGAALRLEDAGVSRLHARLRLRDDGAAEVEDLGSKNGLRMNGRSVGGPAPFGPGDELLVGATSLRLIDPSAERPSIPAGRPEEMAVAEERADLPHLELRAAGRRALAAAGLILLAAAAVLADAALVGG